MKEEELINSDVDNSSAKLAEGLIYMYDPNVKRMSRSIAELVRNQKVLIETTQQENMKYDESLALNLDGLFDEIKCYQTKLCNIKKQMLHLHEKSRKLRQRAERLQQQKEKEMQARQLAKHLAREKEEQIIAKPAPRNS